MSSKRPSLADSMKLAVTGDPSATPSPVPSTSPSPVPSAPQRPAALTTAAATSDTAERRGFYAATRVGKVKVTAALDPDTRHRLRVLASKRRITTETLLTEAIGDVLTKYDMLLKGV